MDSVTKEKMSAILKSKDGVNNKLEKILALLTLANLAYGLILKPESLQVHPHNRGSQMVNAFDCRKKGQAIISAGLKPDLLGPSSICIEMSSNTDVYMKQVEANINMCASSEGLLPVPTGSERYLTLGNSHWVMFLKALQGQCLSPTGESLHVPAELESLVASGWKWTVISNSVEAEFPEFPSFCQAALNSVNSNNTATCELEAMLQLANYVKAGMTMQGAIEAVQAAQPTCGKYITDIAQFLSLYTGGHGFPLLTQLSQFCILPANI